MVVAGVHADSGDLEKMVNIGTLFAFCGRVRWP